MEGMFEFHSGISNPLEKGPANFRGQSLMYGHFKGFDTLVKHFYFFAFETVATNLPNPSVPPVLSLDNNGASVMMVYGAFERP
jgi:hypothetical protein